MGKCRGVWSGEEYEEMRSWGGEGLWFEVKSWVWLEIEERVIMCVG